MMAGHTTTLRRLERDLGELVERHERARDLTEFGAYADRPLAFVREVLKGDPWSRQVEIAEAVRDHPLVVVRSANAVGKDWCAARLALWWVYARRGLVLLTGPTERQVREIVMGEVARAFAKARDLPGELYRTTLRLGETEQAGILAFTSTEASRLTGFHAPRVLAVITEAQGIEEWSYESVLACATGSEDRVLAVGNPLVPSGRFYAVSRPNSGWKSLRIAASDTPNVREGRTVIPGLLTREGVERIRAMYGVGGGVYRARVEGEFPEESEEGLYLRSWLDVAAERWRDAMANGTPDGPAVVAVDPARYGPDRTVLAIRRGEVLTELVAWGRTGTMATAGRIAEVLEARGLRGADLVVDEIGVGAGVLDRLRELGLRATGFNAGSRPWDGDRFLNTRAEAYWRLRDRLEAGEIALPPDEELIDELLATEWRPTSDGKVQVGAKDELRSRLGRSPDHADAVVMAFYGARGREPGDYGLTL